MFACIVETNVGPIEMELLADEIIDMVASGISVTML
jgi:hypothetical protein